MIGHDDSNKFAQYEKIRAAVGYLETWARDNLPQLIQDNRGDHDRILMRFRDIQKMLAKDLKLIRESIDRLGMPAEIDKPHDGSMLTEGELPPGSPIVKIAPAWTSEEMERWMLTGQEPQPTIIINGVEAVSVGCEGQPGRAILETLKAVKEFTPDYSKPDFDLSETAGTPVYRSPDGREFGYSETRHLTHPKPISPVKRDEKNPMLITPRDLSHDLPETEGSPLWIWSSGDVGSAMFEDFRGCKIVHQVRMPIGWSLVSRRKGGTFIRNVFGKELSAIDVLERAENNRDGFKVMHSDEP